MADNERMVNIVLRLVDQTQANASAIAKNLLNIETAAKKAGTGIGALLSSVKVSIEGVQDKTKGAAAGVAGIGTAASGAASGVNSVGAALGAAGAAAAGAAGGINQTGNAIGQTSKQAAAAAKQLALLNNYVLNIRKGFTDAGGSVIGFSMALSAIGSAITAPFVIGVQKATEFEASMSAVKGVMQTTDVEFQNVRNTALQLGRDTRYTANEVAETFRIMGQAGIKAGESMVAMPSVLQLTTAGSLDLADAAGIAVNVMRSYGIAAEGLDMVNDRLVAAFTNSNSTMRELGDAFKYVAPIAKAMGTDFDDLTGAMAALHTAGIKGSMAGTTLRGVLQGLYNPTKADARLMAELSTRIGGAGLQIKNSKGDFVGFQSIVEQLEKAGIKGEESLRLFGLRAGPGMQALVNAGSEALGDLNDVISTSDGLARRIANTMEDTMYGAWKRFESAITGLGIAVGNNLLPMLAAMADFIAEAINKFTEFHDALGPVATVIDVLIATVGGLVLALGVLGVSYTYIIAPIKAATVAVFVSTAAMKGATASTITLGGAIRILGAAIYAALGPVGMIVLGAAAAIGVMVAAYNSLTESVDENIKKNDELEFSLRQAGHAYERYKEKLKGLNINSVEARDINKKLREELIKTSQAKGMSQEFVDAANRAKDSINETTGAVVDNGKALEAWYKIQADNELDAMSEQILNLGNKLNEAFADKNILEEVFSFFHPATDVKKSFAQISEEVRNYSGVLTTAQVETRDYLNALREHARIVVTALARTGKVKISADPKEILSSRVAMEKYIDTLRKMEKFNPQSAAAIREYFFAAAKGAKDAANDPLLTAGTKASVANQKLIDDHKAAIEKIKNSAIDQILAVQLAEAKALKGKDLLETEKIKITSDASDKIFQIKIDEADQLLQIERTYLAALLAERKKASTIDTSKQEIVSTEQGKKRLTIQQINDETAVKAAAANAQGKIVEESYRRQVELARAGLAKVDTMAEGSYSLGLMSLRTYYNNKEELLKKSQELDLVLANVAVETSATEPQKEKALHDLMVLKIKHKEQLVKLTTDETKATRALLHEETAMYNELKYRKLALDATEPGLSKLDRLKAEQALEKEQMLDAFEEKTKLEVEQGKSIAAVRDSIALFKEEVRRKDLDNEREYYSALAETVAEYASIVENTFSAIYDLQKQLSDYKLAALETDIANEEALRAQGDSARINAIKTAHSQEIEAAIQRGASLGEVDRMKAANAEQITQLEIENDTAATNAKMANDKRLADAENKERERQKAAFIFMKAASIASIIANTFLAASKANVDGGTFAGPILAAMIIAGGMANVATVASQKMAEGGWVGGSSPTDSADNIPVNLTAKEYVMPVAAGRKYGDRIMNAMRMGMYPRELLSSALDNMGAFVPRVKPSYALAAGGPVPSSQGDSAGGKGQMVNIVNLVDPSLFEKYTSSEKGQQSIVNVISEKAYQIKHVLNQG